MDFANQQPPPALSFPSGRATLTEQSFRVTVLHGLDRADSGRILALADDGTWFPVFEFVGTHVSAFKPHPEIPGSGGTFYTYDKTWELTSAQIDHLLAGRWVMEITYGTESHLGQLQPIPEPAMALLLGAGLLMMAPAVRRRLRH